MYTSNFEKKFIFFIVIWIVIEVPLSYYWFDPKQNNVASFQIFIIK